MLLTKGTGWVNKVGTGHSLHKMTTLGISGNKLTVCIALLSLSNQIDFKTSTGAHTNAHSNGDSQFRLISQTSIGFGPLTVIPGLLLSGIVDRAKGSLTSKKFLSRFLDLRFAVNSLVDRQHHAI